MLFSCKRTDDITPEKEENTFKVIITNEREIQKFTEQIDFTTESITPLEVWISGADWDKVYDHPTNDEELSRQVFEKVQTVPSKVSYILN